MVVLLFVFVKLEIMMSLPCNLHFMGPECEDGKFYCKAALEDPAGIHLVHGTGHRFMQGKVFGPIYKIYKKVGKKF